LARARGGHEVVDLAITVAAALFLAAAIAADQLAFAGDEYDVRVHREAIVT
jgi:hypothetical protein